MKGRGFLVIIALLFSCQDEYHSVMYSQGGTVDTLSFKSPDDTTAFKHAVERYWVTRSSLMKAAKMLGREQPLPVTFLLMDDSWNLVEITEAEKERLASRTVKYFRDSVIPFIDTIIPYKDRVQEKQADIYK